MSIENVKKLKDIGADFRKALCEQNDEIGDKLFDQTRENLENIIQTKDVDILPQLFDLFILEDLEYTGVCESLSNDIWDNFSEEQIIRVFDEKFDDLLKKNMLRACTTSIAIINTGHFDDLRRVFNKVRSEESLNFVEELSSWGSKKKFRDEALVLKEDMESWG